MVAAADGTMRGGSSRSSWCWSWRLRHLRHLGGAAERQLLRGAVPLAVLLAVPRGELRARHAAAGRLVVEPLAGLPDPLDPARLPGHLLLLPQGLLPLVLLVAAGLRRPRRAPAATAARRASRSSSRTSTATSSGCRCWCWSSSGGTPSSRSASRTGFGIGLGTLILVANAALLSLYTFSCHSCRYLCGGYLDSFAKAPIRYRLWRTANG